MAIQHIADVYQFLDTIPAFKNEGKAAADFSLERFRKFCAAAGNPQNRFPSIHVAGSNGKGSTCHIIASIYLQAGYRVGVYTSPHILEYEERFTINGEQIKANDLILFFQTYHSLIKSFRLTYFEVSTAVAFWWFARRQVDVAVIETGLGGRLDATNVIMPLASVITTVTLDHTDILGDTIAAIAAEKAGIIKQDVPVVLGKVPGQAHKVIKKNARQMNADFFESTQLQPTGKRGKYKLVEDGRNILLESSLQTPVQAFNIAAAWQLTTLLQSQLPVTEMQKKEGIARVGENYLNRARFEKMDSNLDWYFDGAHNIEAVQAMKQMVRIMQPVNQTTLVLCLMNDKINKKMIEEFSEFKKIIYYTLPLERAATLNDVKDRLPDVQSFPARQNSRNKLLKEFESELVIFAGSFYFYATVRDWLSSFTKNR